MTDTFQGKYRVECIFFRAEVTVDDRGIIIDGPKVIRLFEGQHISELQAHGVKRGWLIEKI